MLRKTILLRRRKLIILVGLAMAGLTLLAISPLVIGVTMMTIEEWQTGEVQSEANSVWGVLPWLTIVTLAVFVPLIKVIGSLIALATLHDLVLIFKEARP